MYNVYTNSGEGTRLPLILFHKNSFKLLFCFPINGVLKYFDSKEELIPLEWTTITVKQVLLQGSEYRFSIDIDHREIHHMINKQAVEYSNVKIAMGDRFHSEGHAEIKNFKLVDYGKFRSRILNSGYTYVTMKLKAVHDKRAHFCLSYGNHVCVIRLIPLRAVST